MGFSATGFILCTINGTLDGEALTLQLHGALFAVEKVLTVNIDVEPSFNTLMVLTGARGLPICPSALSSSSSIIVGD